MLIRGVYFIDDTGRHLLLKLSGQQMMVYLRCLRGDL
jgi:hypothetical protein